MAMNRMIRLALTFPAVLAAGGLFGAPGADTAAGLSLVPAAEARTPVSFSVDFHFFRRSLDPYGRWVQRGRYGWVWVPARVDRHWRPYSVGRWAYTRQHGWMWVSAEPWGWATYHYGSWDYEPGFGWYWVPGYVWGPAWVTWSFQSGVIGWAPIPPRYVWGGAFDDFFHHRPRVHIRHRDAWCFVPVRHFGAHRADHVLVDQSQHSYYVQQTTVVNVTNVTNITNITVVNNQVVNQGVALDDVNREAEAPITPVQVALAAAPDAGGGSGADPNIIEVYRPVETPVDSDAAIAAAAEATVETAAETAGVPIEQDSVAPEAEFTQPQEPEPVVPETEFVSPQEPDLAPPSEPEFASPPESTFTPPSEPEFVPPPEPEYAPPPEPEYAPPPEPEYVPPSEPEYTPPPEPEFVPPPEPDYVPPPEPEYAPPPQPEFVPPAPAPEPQPQPAPPPPPNDDRAVN